MLLHSEETIGSFNPTSTKAAQKASAVFGTATSLCEDEGQLGGSLPRFNRRAGPWSCHQKLKTGESLTLQNADQILHFASSLHRFSPGGGFVSMTTQVSVQRPGFTPAEPVHLFSNLINICWHQLCARNCSPHER